MAEIENITDQLPTQITPKEEEKVIELQPAEDQIKLLRHRIEKIEAAFSTYFIESALEEQRRVLKERQDLDKLIEVSSEKKIRNGLVSLVGSKENKK